MAENMKIVNDSGSIQRVAFDLMSYINARSDIQLNEREELLDLYAECIKTVYSRQHNERP